MKRINYIRGILIRLLSHRVKCAGIPSVENNVNISSGKGGIKIGKKAHFQSNSKLSAVGSGEIIIGDGFGINRNSIIVAREKIVIGDNCSIGPNVAIYDHNHKFDKEGIQKTEYRSTPIIIGNNVWIGANVVILRGTIIGEGAVIGAGSVISGNIPSHVIVTANRDFVIHEIR